MTLTKRDGSPAPSHLKVSREWTYDVVEAGEALSEFSEHTVFYEDVLGLIHSWIEEDVREHANQNLPAIQEVYVTEDTAQEQNTSS